MKLKEKKGKNPITNKREILKEKKYDNRVIKHIKEQLELSDDYINQLNEYPLDMAEKPESLLEKIAFKMKQISIDRSIQEEDIIKIEKAMEKLTENFEKLKSKDDKKVKYEIEILNYKIKRTISQMNLVIEKKQDRKTSAVLILDKLTDLSSDIEPYKDNLGANFSYINETIDNTYEKKVKTRENLKRVFALGLTAATIAGTSTAIVYVHQDSEAKQVIDGLENIYGNDIPEEVKNKYIDENGKAKNGAKEAVKKEMLSKLMESKINEILKNTESNTKVKNIELIYGKENEDNYRYQNEEYFVGVKGKTDNEKEWSIQNKYVTRFDTHDGSKEVLSEYSDKEVKKIYEYIKKLDIKSILKMQNNEEKLNEFSDIMHMIIDGSAVKATAVHNIDKDNREFDDFEL